MCILITRSFHACFFDSAYQYPLIYRHCSLSQPSIPTVWPLPLRCRIRPIGSALPASRTSKGSFFPFCLLVFRSDGTFTGALPLRLHHFLSELLEVCSRSALWYNRMNGVSLCCCKGSWALFIVFVNMIERDFSQRTVSVSFLL